MEKAAELSCGEHNFGTPAFWAAYKADCARAASGKPNPHKPFKLVRGIHEYTYVVKGFPKKSGPALPDSKGAQLKQYNCPEW